MKTRIGRLCVITDTTSQSRRSHAEIAALAIDGGADVIQFRDKSTDAAARRAAAETVHAVCAAKDVTMVVNDDVELAAALSDAGVHVGADDTPVSEARAVLGPRRIVGATAGTLARALEMQAAGADYVGFGHIFPTTSKHKPTAPVGLDALAEVCNALRIPVIAIGGIDETNAGRVARAGAHGVAVIAAVCAADDPTAAARRIRDAFARA